MLVIWYELQIIII